MKQCYECLKDLFVVLDDCPSSELCDDCWYEYLASCDRMED